MKQTTFLILLAFSPSLIFCQSKQEKIDELFEQINCKEIIEQGFNGIRFVVDNNKKKLFNEFELDFNNKADVQEFDEFLNEEIELIKGEAYVYISDKYSRHYSEKELQKFIDLTKKNKSKKDILNETNFKVELDSILDYQGQYLKNDIRLILTKIRAKYRPLILKFVENDEEKNISAMQLDLLLNTSNAENPKLSILNKSNAEIILPDNLDFNTVKSLTIKLNDKNYTIERYNMNLPELVREVSSPLKKDGFEDLEYWTLTINDDEISLKIKAEVIFEK
ncbi:hypothetical protein ITJ86_13125 [Winogradskyella sp. F6397]|uniref:Uncharacterized protein n=1 Tax=Winogradskyella marina TaxID=2785530 RepID=A0ABS0EK59_9FLAO|nr:hypothetical protein [Winogradskyella marina]MBF8150848.1 hypothetical protein [Winogradskyella marina]